MLWYIPSLSSAFECDLIGRNIFVANYQAILPRQKIYKNRRSIHFCFFVCVDIIELFWIETVPASKPWDEILLMSKNIGLAILSMK